MMLDPRDRKSLLITLSVLILVLGVTYLITIYAQGYQLDFKQGPTFKATGLLSATSKPKSASVYIDNRLITATDDTINLPPGDYTIKIVRDGYLPWEKKVHIKKEVVFNTDAQLYRSVPDLKPLTLTGAINPSISFDSTRIVYSVASASATRDNGLYLIELNDGPIPINRNTARQIAPNFPGIDWSKFEFVFSPNSRQILATLKNSNISYLLSLDTQIDQRNLVDVTPRLSLIKDDWQNQVQSLIQLKLDRLPKDIRDLVSTDSAHDVQFSPEDDKVLYLAKNDGAIKDGLISPPPAQSTQDQNRQVKKDNYYVYDLKDDTNFLIGTKSDIGNPSWLPNSSSLMYVQEQNIKVVDYDATNRQTIFAGTFEHNNVYPWADGTRIVVLTAAFPGAPQNLYAISIR